MGLFRRKRKPLTRLVEVNMSSIKRQLIYDSVFDDVEGIAATMGLAPISEEVADMEAEASTLRISKFMPLMPLIDGFTDSASEIAASAYKLEMINDNPEEEAIIGEDYEHILGLFKIVALSSAVSCLAALMDLNLLTTEVDFE